jgi:hypothetical protein
MAITDQPTRIRGVPPDPRGAGIYACVTSIARRLSVTIIQQDEGGEMRLLAHETVDGEAAAIAVVNASAAAAGVPEDRVHVTGLHKS